MEKGLMEVKVMGIRSRSQVSNPVVRLSGLSGPESSAHMDRVFEAEAISRGLEGVMTLRP